VIKLWDLRTGELRHTLSGHSKEVTSVAFSPGSTLASGSGDRTIKLWNPDTGKFSTLSEHLQAVTSVTFSPDGQTLASGSGTERSRFGSISLTI